MTERLYYTDAYLRTFEADVVERAESGRRVYLDRTGFYPTSGGQPNDTGRLGGIPVLDVVDESDRVAHLLAAPLPGDRVSGEIDWPRRFDHMQQHTGQHLVSAVLAELFGCATVSVHFGRDSSTLDLETGDFGPDQVSAAEVRANAVVVENRPVSVGFEQPDAAAGLRKAVAREGPLRIVTIADLDRSACGGTHVRATGEIGPILLTRAERVKRRVRLEFLCGARAVRRARAHLDLLDRLAAPLSAAVADLPALLEAQRAELRQATAARAEADQRLDALQARELYQASMPTASGARPVVRREDRGDPDRLRGLGRAVAALPGAVFIGAMVEPPVVMIGSSESSGVDAAGVLRAALGRVGGRGGGSPQWAQGSAPVAELEGVVAELLAAVR